MAFNAIDFQSNTKAYYKFDETFGKMGVADEQTYYDPLNGIDLKESMAKSFREEVSKAPSFDITSGGTYTGYGLMPPFLDPSIVDRTVRMTPLVAMLPRKAIRGRSYVYNVLTAKAGAQFLPDNSVLTNQVDTRTTATVNMKYLYAVGELTGPAMRSAEGFLNLMAEDIRVKTASMNEKLENEIINGNTAVDANGFTGLIQSLTTNAENNAAAAITLDLMRTDLNTAFEANGMTNLIVTDGYTFNYVKGLLVDFQRVLGVSPLMQFGIPDAFEFDGVTVIKDRYMPTTATQREMLYLDTRYVFLAVLQDYTFETLGKLSDADRYFIKWYGSLVVTFEAAMVRRYNLA